MATNGYSATDLTTADARKLVGKETGNAFAVGDRLYRSLDDEVVYLSHEVESSDLARMLAADGNARKIERVLSLPIRGAGWEIDGTGPESVFLREHVGPLLGGLIEQCTGALVYRRAFFEKVFTVRDGLFVYDKLAWRPPSSCMARFDEKTGTADGFEQRLSGHNLWHLTQQSRSGVPGQVTIPGHKAFIYVHGRHREPVKGISELEVAYNAYDKKQKLKFLWGQYLENQSLPKLAVYGRDTGDAQGNAELYAQARASGVIPQVLSPDQPRAFDVIESSGQGGAQFLEAIKYFDAEQTNSVLAGFTDLASAAASGRGSYALSADQSEFFLAAEQAVADEIADQIRHGVFGPLITLNFGVDAAVPGLRIGPIGNRQTDRALELLSSLLVAPGVNAPDDFLDQLMLRAAPTLGMDGQQLARAVEGWRDRAPATARPAPAPEVEPGQQQQLDGMPQA